MERAYRRRDPHVICLVTLGTYTSPRLNAATAADGRNAQPIPPRRLRVVIADDDRDTVLTLAEILRDEGHIVVGVYRGTDVLEAVTRMRPDAVILDIAMPGQSGFAVAQDIRASYYGIAKPLLIAISGQYKGQADKLLSQMVGFDHHLTKPCHPGDLLSLLRPLTLPPDPAGD